MVLKYLLVALGWFAKVLGGFEQFFVVREWFVMICGSSFVV